MKRRHTTLWIMGAILFAVAVFDLARKTNPGFEWDHFLLSHVSQISDANLVEKRLVSGSIHPERVEAYQFEFELPNGDYFEGTSYGYLKELMPGDRVQIEYLSSDPNICRIIGTMHIYSQRPEPSMWFVLLAGLILLVIALEQSLSFPADPKPRGKQGYRLTKT